MGNVLIPHINEVASTRVKRMVLPKENNAAKTKTLITGEERLYRSQQFHMANEEIQKIGQDAKIARERHFDKFGDTALRATKSALDLAETRRQATQQQRRRSQQDLAVLDEEIDTAWEGVSRGTGIQKIASFRKLEDAYEKQDEIKSTLESIASMDSDSGPKSWKAGLSSLRATHSRENVSQTARSVSLSPARTNRLAHHSDKVRNRSHPSFSFARLRSNSDVASTSISKARRKSATWPPRSRASYSENSFLSKRAKDTGNSDQKRRIKSEPISRRTHHNRHGIVGGGSRHMARTPTRKFTLAALRKALSIKNVDAETKSVYPLHRKSSVVPKGTQTVAKRARSVNQHPGSRSSQRISQKRNRATSLQRADEPLKNRPSRKRKRSKEPGLLEKYSSRRLRPRLKHTTGIEKQSLPNRDKTAKKRLTVNIPANTDMATDLRGYSQWPDDSGALVTTQGCLLLPGKYDFSGIQEFEWICPVRSCRSCFQDQKKLGAHFVSYCDYLRALDVRNTADISQISHHSCLFNDNCDGTFTIVGKYTESQNDKNRPALVKSKSPLPMNAPPMMEPRPPVTWRTDAQQKPFVESLNKARSLPAPDSREVKTVDEMMLHTGFLALSSVATSDASELSELSRTPSFQDVDRRSSKKAASATRSNPPDDAESEEENALGSPVIDQKRHKNVSNAPRDAAKENWRQIRKHLTGRQFYPPKTGRSHFAALLSSPRTRDIVLRPGLRFIADQPKKVRLLMVHMTGEEPQVACHSCALGRGPFNKCVAISKAAAGETTNGIVCCTNCASKRDLQHRCNVGYLLGQQNAGQQRKQRKGGLDSAPREQASPGNISSRVTKVDSRFTLAVHELPVDGSLNLGAENLSIRLCSVAAGKVMVDLEGNLPFSIGPHGMFKLMPETSAQVWNTTEAEAVIHVSTLES